MALTFQYLKKRADFGRQPMFCEQGPELCDSIPQNPAAYKQYMLRNPVNHEVQHGPIYARHYVNTIRAEYTSTSQNHAEGGWPKDVNVLDIEATQRYRRKTEKEDNYIHCVMELAPEIEHYVNQNNAIDMYRTFNADLAPIPPVEKISCRTVNVYRDNVNEITVGRVKVIRHRPISSISWQPEGGQKFAVTYVDVDFFQKPKSSIDCFIWDVEHPLGPEMTIEPPCPMLDLQFNPREPQILAGALMSGQVGGWDLRSGSAPIALCPPHVAHREYVKNVLFINTKSGMEFYSGGPDGVCKWWDFRNLSEPTDEVIIDICKNSFDVPSMITANPISVLEYEPTIPTRYLVGTENGMVVSGNRKGKSAVEKLPAKFDVHLGPVRSLERSPGFLKNFLTVGDWTARIWSEDCKESSVIWSPPSRYKITSGTWSPGRLSMMLLSQANGILSLWDLLRHQTRPVLTMQVAEEPLVKLRMHENSTLVACGSAKGHIYMVELSHTLAQSGKNDKVMMTAIFERESKRERLLEARLREIKLKLRQGEEGSPVTSATRLDPSIGDRDLHEAATDYMQHVRKELAAM